MYTCILSGSLLYHAVIIFSPDKWDIIFSVLLLLLIFLYWAGNNFFIKNNFLKDEKSSSWWTFDKRSRRMLLRTNNRNKSGTVGTKERQLLLLRHQQSRTAQAATGSWTAPELPVGLEWQRALAVMTRMILLACFYFLILTTLLHPMLICLSEPKKTVLSFIQ